MTSKMSIQGLLPKEREYWFPESRRHILTIVLVKTMFMMWRRFLKLDLNLILEFFFVNFFFFFSFFFTDNLFGEFYILCMEVNL